MNDIVIKAENLGKMYTIGHQAERGGYTALRDVLMQNARTLWNKTKDMATGKAIIQGDTMEEVWALKDVSFEIKRGEAVGIIGRNGAGKSTLLKILSRITEPTTGRVTIKGRVASLLEVGTGFHPELSGRENIYLNGTILGMTRVEIKRKFDEIVAFAEIEKFIDTPVKRYSSGMYMRLAFAVAAHLEPEILLVDEVLAVGDAAFQKKCLGKMGDVSKEGRTILFVSHNMAAVEKLCARAMLLFDGYLQRTGSVGDVIAFYLSANEEPNSREKGVLARNASGSLELISIGPVDEHGNKLVSAQCGHNVTLSMSLRSTVGLPKMTVSIGINNIYDARITVLHSKISGHEMTLSPGAHSVLCRVPRFSLSAGSYFMDAKVYSGDEVFLWAPHVKKLIIEESDFYNTGKLPDPSWGGFCYLEQTWEVIDES